MKSRITLILVAGLLLAAQTPKEDAVKADVAKLQGEWEMVSLVHDGRDAPAEAVKAHRRKIEGTKYTVTITKDGEVHTIKGSFTLDPAGKPKTIDVKPDEGEAKEKGIKGIYELDGDTQKLCMAAIGEERPKEFAAKEGTRRTLIVWKRVKS